MAWSVLKTHFGKRTSETQNKWRLPSESTLFCVQWKDMNQSVCNLIPILYQNSFGWANFVCVASFKHKLCCGSFQEHYLCWHLSLELSSTVPVPGITIRLTSPTWGCTNILEHGSLSWRNWNGQDEIFSELVDRLYIYLQFTRITV